MRVVEMGVDLMQVTKELVEALFVGNAGCTVVAQSPLPESTGGVPSLFKNMTPS